MLSGIRVFSSDECWRRIATDLNATVVADAKIADVNLDSLELQLPISPIELKTAIIAASDGDAIIQQIFGKRVDLSPLQTQIVIKLYQSGGMTTEELKMSIGYAKNAATHTVETAIYSLRKLFGHDFIINENGLFRIGRI